MPLAEQEAYRPSSLSGIHNKSKSILKDKDTNSVKVDKLVDQFNDIVIFLKNA